MTSDASHDFQPPLDLELEDQKQAQLEEERAALMRDVVSANLDTIQKRVAWILNHFPETRNSDITLQIKYWERFDSDLYQGQAIDPELLYELTRLTSLQRARAKIQNSYGLFQASAEVKRRRGKLSEEEKEKAAAQQPALPTFAVYADESGKTQEHLVVGSMWFPYPEELASLTLDIQRLKQENDFKGELHFQEINASRIAFYKELARLVGEKAHTYSFKAISVERRGIASVPNAFRDLYFQLLLEGVKHEVESRRALLPRKLQLLKDAEEPGSDKLLLKWLHDQMVSAAETYFDSELHPDVFIVEDSELSEALQVADLFTSSISRQLNATGDRKAPKDEFAQYFLNAVDLPSPVDKKGQEEVIYHLSL